MVDLIMTTTKSTCFTTKKQMRFFVFLFPPVTVGSTPAATTIHLNIYMTV